MLNLHPATATLTEVIERVPPGTLDAPTPCEGTSVAQLLDHLDTFAGAFAAIARKEEGDVTTSPPAPDAAHLDPDWRARLPVALAALADTWTHEAAWEGMTRAGGVELSRAMAGRVALGELVVHGWDLAVATGQPFTCEGALAEVVEDTARHLRGGDDGELPGLYGPVVPVPEGAPPLDRALAQAGRDPAWAPPAQRRDADA